ncbi:MAG: diacylglycerol kinase family protein [Alphaproteobacteria bacterium]
MRDGEGPAARSLYVIFNPAGRLGRRRWLARALAVAGGAGARATVAETAGPGHATDLAARLPAGTDMVVVGGGDGLVNEAVNGLLSRDGATPPVAVLPFGTANVLAAELGFAPGDRDGAARAAAAGPTRRITLGRANGRWFTMMAGVGFDAEVVAAVRPRLKRVIGKGAFALAGVATFARWRPRRYVVESDAGCHEAGWIVVANGRYWAGRYVCAPGADLAAPSLQLVLFGCRDRLALLRALLAVAAGRVARHADARLLTVTRARIAAADGAAEAVQIDGDIAATLPLTIEAVADALTVVRPV